MRPLLIPVLVASMFVTVRAQETNRPASRTGELSAGELQEFGQVEVTCKLRYYRKAGDGLLVPPEKAGQASDFRVSGIVFEIVRPVRLAGQVVAYHFDFPQKWDRSYKPNVQYAGLLATNEIGRLAFLCDPGWRAVTNVLSAEPNPQGGANRRQPFGSDTNRTSAAAASSRSP